MKILSYLLLAPCFLLLTTGCSSSTPALQDPDTILIGGVAPLTGAAVPYSIPIQQTTDMVIEEMNQQGGVNGKKIKVIWEDTKCNPREATMSAQKLITASNVAILFGESCTGSVLAMAPIAEKHNVLFLNTGSQGEQVRYAGDNVFRTSPSGKLHIEKITQFSRDQGWQKIAFLTQQTDYCHGIEEEFSKRFNGEIQSERFLDEERDFRVRLTKLKNQGDIDALFINVQTIDRFTVIFKQLLELDWQIPLLAGTPVVGDEGYFRRHQPLIDKYEAPFYAGHFKYEHRPGYEDFHQRYLKRYDLEHADFPVFNTTTRDGLFMIKYVIEESCPDHRDTKCLRTALNNLKNFKGLSGTLSFDPDGEIQGIESTLVQYRDGAFRAVDQ